MDIKVQIQLNQIMHEVDRILHMPNNGFYGVGKQDRKILEMTVVIDRGIPGEDVERFLPEMVRSLKRHDDVFRDVRMNLVEWRLDGACRNTVIPMLKLTMSGFYEEWKQGQCTEGNQVATEEKTYQNLYAYLKKFHARSRLVILLCAAWNADGDAGKKQQELLPFLGRKMIRVQLENKEVTLCCRNDF